MEPAKDPEERPDLEAWLDARAEASESEVDGGRFSIVCPRHGVRAELRVEGVSGSVRAFSCSVPGDDEPDRRRCQAACARWVLGEG